MSIPDSTSHRLVDGFDSAAPIERASMPPAHWYTSGAWRDFEMAEVIGPSWIPVCARSAVDMPGRWVSGCTRGVPWIVLRGQDSTLRAFANVCRHKGAPLVGAQETGGGLVCTYHAWRYDDRGQLRSAPQLGGVEQFDRGSFGLAPIGVSEWGPLVFVHPRADATPLHLAHPEVHAALTATGWEALHFVERRTFRMNCNWKVYVDNYLDGGYHISHVHPSLDAQLDMGSYRTELYEQSSLQTSAPTATERPDLGFDPRVRVSGGALYAWLFPNFMVNRYGPVLDTNFVIPVSLHETEVVYDFFFADVGSADAQHFVQVSMAQSAVTQEEDGRICEAVQLGLASGAYEPGRYAPRVEMAEHHFHRLLAQAKQRERNDPA